MKVLTLFNKVWKSGKVPLSWKGGIFIPTGKPGKEPSKPINYRAITLTSHIGKIMERMINKRLMHCIEKRGLVTGCRRGRSTMDPVLCLEDDISKKKKQVWWLLNSLMLKKHMTCYGEKVC